MYRLHTLRACLAAALMLFLAGAAQAQTVKIHVKNPWPTTPMWQGLKVIGAVIAGPPGAPMTDDGDGWFSYTLPASLPGNGQFMIVMYSPATWDATQPDYASQKSLRPSGTGGAGAEFNIATFRNIAEEVWVIPNGTGAPILTDIPQAKKVAMLFNPWPANAPTAKVGNQTAFSVMHQSQDVARCGWYGAYFNAAPFTVSFKSLFGTESYGLSGMGDTKALDLTTYFATSDTIWLTPDPIPGGAPKITNTIPAGVTGTCSFKLAVTVRDFSIQHPDFEKAGMASDVAIKGMVAAVLDTGGKPSLGPKPYTYQKDFPHWFRDKKTGDNQGNVTYCKDLPMKKSSKGMWGYNSFKDDPSHSYFPIDKENTFGETATSQYIDLADGTVHNDPTGAKHNFAFCMEMHATFKYQKGQVFNFIGDDDVWAFIDKKLVMDIGGPHPPIKDSIVLDKLGLTTGQDYPFDFFFCERHTTGSDLMVETSIFFEQQQSVFAKPIKQPDGSITYEIWEITSGDASCGAVKGGKEELAVSTFKLSGPSVNPAEELPVGIKKYGGILVDPAKQKVTVDTNAIVGLRPGVYTITYITASNKGSTLQFTVPGTYTIEFSDKRPVNEILKTAVGVTIQASLSGTPDKREEVFQLKPQAGLTMYADSAMTLPIAAGADLKTDAATGALKIWVTSATPGTYKLDLYGGKANLTNYDTFNNLTFFQQPKVATPTANPPAMVFITPIAVSLGTSTTGAAIWYTDDNSVPVPGAGTAKLWSAAIPLSATTTIKAIAVKAGWIDSDILTVTYAYTAPLAIRKSYYKDLNGDGRVETVILEFEKDIPVSPDKLDFTLTDAAGKTVTRSAAKAEIAFAAGSKNTVVVTLANPFDFGSTSVANAPTAGKIFKQDNIPTLEGTFPVADSVPPVITEATVKEPDSTQLLKRIIITLSENGDLPLTSQTVLVFKKDGVEAAPGKVKIHHIEKTGDRSYTVFIDSTSDVYPVLGDSVALNTSGEVKDLLGNTPAKKAFLKMLGDPVKPKPMNIYVTFPNSRKDQPASALEPQGNAVFIPVDKNGAALPGSAADGKCPGCYTGTSATFVGPVFHIVTPGPMAYDFRIFNTHGEFVARGKGVVTPDDLEGLEKKNDASGIKYIVRVVWTGRTEQNGKAATGAYILQSTLTSDKDPRTGAPPGHDSRKITFGMLRSFRGS